VTAPQTTGAVVAVTGAGSVCGHVEQTVTAAERPSNPMAGGLTRTSVGQSGTSEERDRTFVPDGIPGTARLAWRLVQPTARRDTTTTSGSVTGHHLSFVSRAALLRRYEVDIFGQPGVKSITSDCLAKADATYGARN
jgi:hypothetical protein